MLPTCQSTIHFQPGFFPASSHCAATWPSLRHPSNPTQVGTPPLLSQPSPFRTELVRRYPWRSSHSKFYHTVPETAWTAWAFYILPHKAPVTQWLSHCFRLSYTLITAPSHSPVTFISIARHRKHTSAAPLPWTGTRLCGLGLMRSLLLRKRSTQQGMAWASRILSFALTGRGTFCTRHNTKLRSIIADLDPDTTDGTSPPPTTSRRH